MPDRRRETKRAGIRLTENCCRDLTVSGRLPAAATMESHLMNTTAADSEPRAPAHVVAKLDTVESVDPELPESEFDQRRRCVKTGRFLKACDKQIVAVSSKQAVASTTTPCLTKTLRIVLEPICCRRSNN